VFGTLWKTFGRGGVPEKYTDLPAGSLVRSELEANERRLEAIGEKECSRKSKGIRNVVRDTGTRSFQGKQDLFSKALKGGSCWKFRM